jgi:hypothetical protein
MQAARFRFVPFGLDDRVIMSKVRGGGAMGIPEYLLDRKRDIDITV